MAKRKKLRKSVRKKANKTIRRIQFSSFLVLLLIGFFISLLFPLRPTESESEKRELSHFPSLTFKSFFSGDFFDGIDLWFSDTYPFREALVTASGRLNSLHGFGTKLYGLNDSAQGDEIPDENDTPASADVYELQDPDALLGGTIIDEDAVVQELGNIAVVGDAAYELYSFDKNVADAYAAILNRTANSLDGISDVYDLIVPTSTDITLADNVREKLHTTSQADAIRYIFSCMNPKVHSVNVYNALREHRTEYIYFRTDHHWTADGAFYAYEELCRVMGVPSKPLTAFTKYKFEGFTGSFVSESKKNANLLANKDTVYAYDPIAETTLTYYNKSGKGTEWKVIYDVTGWNPNSLYSTFIAGDNPYTKITNATTDNPKKCLVIKESFGNAFVPFVAADFSEVHVIDYRYWSGSISQFVRNNNIDVVLFINNISATRSSSLMKKLSSITN